MGEISKILSTLFLRIDSLVYGFISVLYQKFIALASLKMFNDAIYARIENMVFMIVGVLALFLIAYNLLKHMIDADLTKSTADVKKVVINLVTSMFMIMLIPITFNLLFSIQNAILKQDLIGKLFQPYTTDFENSEHLNSCLLDSKVLVYNEETDEFIESSDSDTVTNVKLKCYGNLAALQMFQGFFYPTSVDDAAHTESYKNGASLTETLNNAAASVHPESASFLEWIGKIGKFAVEPFPMKIIDIINAIRNAGESTDEDFSLADAYDVVIASGDFGILELFTENIESGEIKYTFLVSTIAGGFACYVLFLYCLDVAVRAVKLAFYQMIAPLPIMMRIVPKKGTDIFNNWLKCVSTTYFEIFSRLAILYFGMYFISNIFVLMGEGMSSSNIGYDLMSGSLFGVGVWLLVKANIILGIFAFMKKAPELLKQIVPSSDKFSLKLWDHLKDSFAVPAAIGGFAGGMIAGGGNPLAGFRAAAKGWNESSLRGIGAEEERRRKVLLANRRAAESGQGFWTRTYNRAMERGRNILGRDTTVDEYKRQLDRGIDFRDNSTIQVTNDTPYAIELVTSEGDRRAVYNSGATIDMTKETKELIESTRKYIATLLSEIGERLRNVNNAMNSNKSVADFYSQMKDRADSQLEKGDCDIRADLVYSYKDASGRTITKRSDNRTVQGMREYLEIRRKAGASTEELEAIAAAIDDTKTHEMRTKYINQALTDPNGDGKIKSIADNMRFAYENGDVYSAPGVRYVNASLDSKIASGTIDADFFKDLESNVQNLNRTLNQTALSIKAEQDAQQSRIAGLDRIEAENKERVEQIELSPEYRQAQANGDYIRNNPSGGNK